MEDLIDKYLLGQATEQELRRLEDWIILSEDNRKAFARAVNICAVTTGPADKIPCDSVDLAGILNRIRKYERRGKIKYFSFAAAAAAIVIFSFFLYFNHTVRGYKDEIQYILAQSGTSLEFSTPYGAKSVITLPDSSVVWLNSGSTISFPSKFSGESRHISFSGEGFFEVAKDSLHPMNISTPSGVTVKVLGTKFNLSAYKDDQDFSLMLLSGKVELVSRGGGEIRKINPFEKFTMNVASRKYTVNKPADTLSVVGWKKGWLIFDDTPLGIVFKNMKRRYGVEVKVQDKELLKKTLSAKFKEESATQVLDLMQRISLLNYTIKDSIVTVTKFK